MFQHQHSAFTGTDEQRTSGCGFQCLLFAATGVMNMLFMMEFTNSHSESCLVMHFDIYEVPSADGEPLRGSVMNMLFMNEPSDRIDVHNVLKYLAHSFMLINTSTMMSGSSTRDSYVVKPPLMTITYCRSGDHQSQQPMCICVAKCIHKNVMTLSRDSHYYVRLCRSAVLTFLLCRC